MFDYNIKINNNVLNNKFLFFIIIGYPIRINHDPNVSRKFLSRKRGTTEN